MAISDVSVVNSALIKIGSDPISSLSQTTRSATLMNAIYESIRDEVLRAHPWNFAIKRLALVALVDVPEFEYSYKYDLPSDCLRVLDTEYDTAENPSAQQVPFVIEGRKLLCNYATLSIRYIFRNDDASSWDINFAEALAWRLAMEVCYALTNSTERADFCAKQYQRTLSDARSYDGMEGIVKGIGADIWAMSRR